MKIAFFELEDWEEKEAKKTFKSHKLSFFNKSLTKEDLKSIKDTEILVVFIYSKINKSIIDNLPKLKYIVTMSTGYDHIDINYCKKKNISISNIPSYGENTVAEHTFALILALSRKLYPSIQRTHEKHSFETDNTLRGFDLKGKTLGIIGCGNIGKHVARISIGFEMNTLVFDRHPDKKLANKIGFKNTSLNELLKKSDILTLHIPYTKQTHHLINKKTIQKMKNNAIIINTSRGGIIDTHALIKALESKKISGAGLDVIEEECEIKEEREILKEKFKSSCDLRTILENHILMKMDNVIITPHNAFNSHEALQRILSTTFNNIKSFISNKPLNIIKSK